MVHLKSHDTLFIKLKLLLDETGETERVKENRGEHSSGEEKKGETGIQQERDREKTQEMHERRGEEKRREERRGENSTGVAGGSSMRRWREGGGSASDVGSDSGNGSGPNARARLATWLFNLKELNESTR